jgi:hypothetical protein
MSDATLNAIRTKVRRLTRSPSTAQLSNEDLDQYINTSILYDFPSNLRLFSLRSTLTFYTQPGVDVYKTNTTDDLDPLFNFKNKYIAIHPPVFISGVPASFTQWRDVFFGLWPETNQVQDTLIDGDGTQGPFDGILNSFPQSPNPPNPPCPNRYAIQHNSVIFTILDTVGTAMIVIDYPEFNTSGRLGLPNQTPDTPPTTYGFINYQTGVFTVSFPRSTMNSICNPLIAEYVPYALGKPISMLYYDNQFTLRPIPDKAYPVQIEVDIRPTELLTIEDVPQIEQWWQWISMLAAKKIFEDRMDMDSVQMILPELRNQMNLVNRTSLTQQANERTTTIYTIGRSYGWGYYNSNFPF